MTRNEAKRVSEAINSMFCAEMMMRDCRAKERFDHEKWARLRQNAERAADSLRALGITIAGYNSPRDSGHS